MSTIPFLQVLVQTSFRTLYGLLGPAFPTLVLQAHSYKYLFHTRTLDSSHKPSGSRAQNNGSLLNRSLALPNTAQAYTAPLSPLEALPTEIKLEILRQTPNTPALRALTHAAYLYHQAYTIDCQKIFMSVLTRELETHNLTTNSMSFFELDTTQPSRPQLSPPPNHKSARSCATDPPLFNRLILRIRCRRFVRQLRFAGRAALGGKSPQSPVPDHDYFSAPD